MNDLRELFGDQPLAEGPYRLIEIKGIDGYWRCRFCRALFVGTVPHRPAATCAKCGAK